ncbi:hypothetical protein LOD99_11795 [Oopsacas minuta]|uniref:Uncharacterized protein n=1 Tax=Oopsacas minuta TaxID=111878 RepID=A0AAV7JM35_9METZ|nr:hypothetical protein LOD99_11795 [Oopsacas minuta]
MFREATNNSNSQISEIIGGVIDYAFYAGQALGLIYTLLCIVWVTYVIASIVTQIRNKRRLLSLMYQDYTCDYTNRLIMQKETIFRYVIFLVFLCFELSYCLNINIFGVVALGHKWTDIQIPIATNCSLNSNTFIGYVYDERFISILQNSISSFRDFSFSMMLWLFGASILHLSFAARNIIRVKILLIFILLGIVIYLLVIISVFIPYINIFGNIAQPFMDQISLFIVVYIAKKRFFPAMNSRVIDAYHLHSTNVYLQQKKLLKQYKVLVFVFLFTFEVYILKNIVFFNLYAITDSISNNPCWFHVTYHVSMFTIPDSTKQILNQISDYCFACIRLIDLVVYLNFILVNLNIMYVTAKKCFKRRFYDRERYRYQVCSNPLLS